MIQAPRIILVILAMMFISACSKEPSAADTAQAFWDAVVANDMEQIKTLSAPGTLKDPSLLDNSKNAVTSAVIGDTVEDGAGTRVATTLIGEKNTDGKATELAVNTVMLKVNEEWKVDAGKTIDNLLAKSINAMMLNMSSNFENIGEQVSKSLSTGVQEFMKEMNKSLPQVQEGLEQLQNEEAMQNLGQSLGRVFSEGIQQLMGDLNKGLEDLSNELEKESQRIQQPDTPQKPVENI